MNRYSSTDVLEKLILFTIFEAMKRMVYSSKSIDVRWWFLNSAIHFDTNVALLMLLLICFFSYSSSSWFPISATSLLLKMSNPGFPCYVCVDEDRVFMFTFRFRAFDPYKVVWSKKVSGKRVLKFHNRYMFERQRFSTIERYALY